jgi:hypothetical protein
MTPAQYSLASDAGVGQHVLNVDGLADARRLDRAEDHARGPHVVSEVGSGRGAVVQPVEELGNDGHVAFVARHR